MALWLTEADVRSLLTMPLALEAVEDAFRKLSEGSFVLHPRRRIESRSKAYLHYMAAADLTGGYAGMKIYTYAQGRLRFLVPLYQFDSGELAALIEADYMGQVRTGAASGVATKYMARGDARTVGVIGTGPQARTQLEAVAAVRPIEGARAFSRTAEHRQRFAQEMSQQLGIPVEPAETPEQAVRGADVVITATTAAKPVLEGKWLGPGAHINAIGANFPHKREIDDEAVRRAGMIVVDSREQSREEAGDLVLSLGEDEARWAAVRELSEIVAQQHPGRTSDRQVTLFKSNGVAIQDVAVGVRLLELAQSRGVGQRIAFWGDPS